jgi:uncharacterized membrane protein YoaK (UPF0700 family)
VAREAESRLARVAVPSIDSSLGTRLLPLALSLIAGSVDVISFLGLGGLFAAHITGNLAIMAAHIVTGGSARLAEIVSVPVFIGALCLTRVLAAGLESLRVPTLRPLLMLQLALLAAAFVLCATAGSPLDIDSPAAVFASMLAVSAMAVQNALVQVSLEGAPATAVMTTNITRFVADIGTIMLAPESPEIAGARNRATHSWQAILGFAAGCALGAACEARFGIWSLLLPTGIALLAVALGLLHDFDRGARR